MATTAPPPTSTGAIETTSCVVMKVIGIDLATF